MKQITHEGMQGDVIIYRIDEFPEGERVEDSMTKEGLISHGESGHAHCIQERDRVDMFKIEFDKFNGMVFVQTKDEAVTIGHGRAKDFAGVEADVDYHNPIKLEPNSRYMFAIVPETDWVNKVVRQVAD